MPVTIEVDPNKLVLVPIDEIAINPNNRNIHTKEQIDRLCELIQYQGFRDPLIISNLSQQLIAGHGRLEAAKKLKMTSVPVIYQDFDSIEQEYAFGVSHNAIASWASLDLSGINTDIGDLGPEFKIELLGMKDFSILAPEPIELDDKPEESEIKKYIIEVLFPNDMEMMDIHDDLVSRGYIVKLK